MFRLHSTDEVIMGNCLLLDVFSDLFCLLRAQTPAALQPAGL